MNPLDQLIMEYMDFANATKNNVQLGDGPRAQILLQMAQALNYLVPLLHQGVDQQAKQQDMALQVQKHQADLQMLQEKHNMDLQHTQQKHDLALQQQSDKHQLALALQAEKAKQVPQTNNQPNNS